MVYIMIVLIASGNMSWRLVVCDVFGVCRGYCVNIHGTFCGLYLVAVYCSCVVRTCVCAYYVWRNVCGVCHVCIMWCSVCVCVAPCMCNVCGGMRSDFA